jgi:hypothetical protein
MKQRHSTIWKRQSDMDNIDTSEGEEQRKEWQRGDEGWER